MPLSFVQFLLQIGFKKFAYWGKILHFVKHGTSHSYLEVLVLMKECCTRNL